MSIRCKLTWKHGHPLLIDADGKEVGKTLILNSELERFLPPLTAEENLELMNLIRSSGCRDALVGWSKDSEIWLADGFHRYEICKRHGWPAEVVLTEFEDEQRCKEWMYKNQNARRNWNDFTRAEIALKLKPELAGKASERKALGGRSGGQRKRKNGTYASLSQPAVREQIAELADVSSRQVDKVEDVLEHATEKLKQACRDGRVSTDAASVISAKCVSEVQDALADGKIDSAEAKILSKQRHDQAGRLKRMIRFKQVEAEKAAKQAELKLRGPLDDAKKPIPESLRAAFATRTHFDAVLIGAVTTIGERSRKIAAELGSDAGRLVSQADGMAKSLYNLFASLRPSVVCGKCKGQGCSVCGDRGYRTKK